MEKKKQTPQVKQVKQVEQASPRKPTEKQRRFVEAYMGKAAGNATEAARIAGYASPRQEGARLLTNAVIRAAIDERVAEDPAVATRKDRQQFWTAKMLDNNEETRDQLRASELLGKSQGDFVEHIENNVTISWMNVVRSAKAALVEQDDDES